ICIRISRKEHGHRAKRCRFNDPWRRPGLFRCIRFAARGGTYLEASHKPDPSFSCRLATEDRSEKSLCSKYPRSTEDFPLRIGGKYLGERRKSRTPGQDWAT